MFEDTSIRKVQDSEHIEQIVYIDNDLTDRVILKLNKCCFINNGMYPKKPIDSVILNNIKKYTNVNVTTEMVDISRTTHAYAKKFNETIMDTIGDVFEETYCQFKGTGPVMLSGADGFSFIGEAFINFVTALIVYDLFPTESSSNLTNYANTLRNNEYLAIVSDKLGLSDTITKLRKVQLAPKQQTKNSAMAYKALVGNMYRDCKNIVDIMRFVNKTVYAKNIIDFTNKEHHTITRDIFIVSVSVVFGWITCYITLVLTPNTCFTPIKLN
jgi:hypothetical protein